MVEGTQQRDLNVKATLLRHGNWDSLNNAVIWDANIPDHTIPNSLYLTGKPSRWGDLPWPPIGRDRSSYGWIDLGAETFQNAVLQLQTRSHSRNDAYKYAEAGPGRENCICYNRSTFAR